MLVDFVILDMAEAAHSQIIIGSPSLATGEYKIDVKDGKLTFDVGNTILNLVCLRIMNLLLLLFLVVDVMWLFLIHL